MVGFKVSFVISLFELLIRRSKSLGMQESSTKKVAVVVQNFLEDCQMCAD